MRKIGIPEIEDIATGAALLGAGGGGDPYVGKLVAIGAVQECGPVTLLDPEEVPDDALVVPIAMMGAPTVLAEKAIGGNEYKKLFDMVSKFFGREIYAFMPIEAGGVNSMLPIAAAARLNMPMVDVDGMGRAFPELQMVTFTIGGRAVWSFATLSSITASKQACKALPIDFPFSPIAIMSFPLTARSFNEKHFSSCNSSSNRR